MYSEQVIIKDTVEQLLQAIEKILLRFQSISSVNDFTHSPQGVERLDSICLQLIVTGELLKKLDKLTGGMLFSQYPQVEWKKAMAMRDIITHHYEKVDAGIIFNTCKDKIPLLKEAVITIKENLC